MYRLARAGFADEPISDFFDGALLGLLAGGVALYLFNRRRASKRKKRKSEVDRLVDDIQGYYRSVSDKEGRD